MKEYTEEEKRKITTNILIENLVDDLSIMTEIIIKSDYDSDFADKIEKELLINGEIYGLGRILEYLGLSKEYIHKAATISAKMDQYIKDTRDNEDIF